ncbi:MAG: hypothetical protein CSA24_02130 [Deltaproteobacteria bacterium]|nr:MAG: hypothetical protein CSA24_02130 [Deltaproteobacteria bacterium]
MAKGDKNKILRVRISQDRRVVEERLLRKHGDVSIGQGPKNTFIVPSPSLPKQFTLFETRGKGYALVFERGMDGRVDLGDQPLTLRELSKKKGTHKRGTTYTTPLTSKARGKVVFGDVTVLFQCVDAPPVMPRPVLPAAAKGGITSQLEWPLVNILVAVFLVLGGSGAGLDLWWTQTGQYYQKQYDRRGDKVYELLKAEVQMQREEKKEEQENKPPEATEEKDAGDTKVEQAPAEPAPKPPTKRVVKRRKPSRAADKRKSSREKLTAKVRRSTFLHVLGSNDGSGGPGEPDSLKHGVHEANLKDAFNLPGGVTQAEDGVTSFVGGPSQATKDGSRYKTLSAGDTGGKRIATTTVKTESKTRRKEIKVRANVRGGSVSGQTGTGQIDKQAVARVFSRRKGAIKHCYEKALKTNPNLRGKVTIRFTIGPAGRITNISAGSNSTGDPSVAQCIISKVRGWRFEPPSGGSVTFSYPFLLDTK